MGCDIHAYLEKKSKTGSYEYVADVFDDRDYNLFSFLAGVRNYNEIYPIVASNRGIPVDVSDYTNSCYLSWGSNAHSASWIGIDELLKFDYTRDIHHNLTPTEVAKTLNSMVGVKKIYNPITYKDFLEYTIFEDIMKMSVKGDRVVFWFDN